MKDHFLDSRYEASLVWRGPIERIECGDGARYEFVKKLYGCQLTFRLSGLERWAVVEDQNHDLQMVLCPPRFPPKYAAGGRALYHPAC